MKKIFAFVLTIVMVACMLTACGVAPENDEVKEVEIEIKHDTDLAEVPGYDYLVYSIETGTVYYFIRTSSGRSGVGYMSPYISNGHFCEYVNGEIVEVIPENATN